MKDVSDKEHAELSPEWIRRIFEKNYIGFRPIFSITECHFKQLQPRIETEVTLEQNGSTKVFISQGNGRLDAVSNALKSGFGISYKLAVYEERAMGEGSGSVAMSYVGIEKDGRMYWGVGSDDDIIRSSIDALVSAINHMMIQG